MKLLDIINPWGALKKARWDADYYRDVCAIRREVLLRDAEERGITAKAHTLEVKNLKAEIRRLEEVIASGHYRNPETGRLGRKGERFDAGAKQQ
jgi:hypothetical protein